MVRYISCSQAVQKPGVPEEGKPQQRKDIAETKVANIETGMNYRKHLGADAEEIATKHVISLHATYWIHLKKEGKQDGKMYVNLCRRSSTSKRRSKVFIGYEDMPELLHHLKEAKSKACLASPEPYAEFHSKMFRTKTFHLSMSELVRNGVVTGQQLHVTEKYNIDGDVSNAQLQSSVFINMEELDEMVQAMESVLSYKEGNADEKVEYATINSKSIATRYFETRQGDLMNTLYIVTLRKECGDDGRLYVRLTKESQGRYTGSPVHINIGAEDVPEFIKHLKKQEQKSSSNPLSGGTEENILDELDSKVFKNKFIFSLTKKGNFLKLTKRYPSIHPTQYIIWVHMADVIKLIPALKKVVSHRKIDMGTDRHRNN